MKYWILPIALAAASCASAGGAPADSRSAADPVIAAERAFAARHQQVSVKQSFAEFAAADGVMLDAGGVRNAHAYLATWPDRDNKGYIVWWPVLAGIARSGELGFTTGDASYGGGRSYTNYFTIWKKQPDGSWKWLIDMGTADSARPTTSATDPVAIVSAAAGRPAPAPRAWAELRAFDAAVGAASGRDSKTLASHYAPEARVSGWRASAIDGADAIRAALADRPPIETKPEGGGVSEAGDFGWTYGYATWSEAGQAKRGSYLRAWQRRAAGWIIVGEIVNVF